MHQFLSAFDVCGFASILVDRSGRVLEWNGRAAVLWCDLFGHESTVRAETEKMLKDLVARCSAKPDVQPWTAATLARPKGRSIIVHVAFLIDAPPDGGAGQGAAVLTLFDPSETRELSTHFLRDAFGLTKSEITLANELCLGKTLKEIARLRETSIATVRVQLRAVFAKTQTSRQAELVALLSRLPPRLESGGAAPPDGAPYVGVDRRSRRDPRPEA